jgi:hypothetical protein
MLKKTALLLLGIFVLFISITGVVAAYSYFTHTYVPLVSDLLLKSKLVASFQTNHEDFLTTITLDDNSELSETSHLIGQVKEVQDNGLFITTPNNKDYFVKFSIPQEQLLVTIPPEKANGMDTKGAFSLQIGDLKVTRVTFLQPGMTIDIPLDQFDDSTKQLSTDRIIYVK